MYGGVKRLFAAYSDISDYSGSFPMGPSGFRKFFSFTIIFFENV